MIAIAIIENNNFYRESLKTALNQIDGFEVVFADDNIALLLDSNAEFSFQIILLDWTYYDTEVTRKMVQLYPGSKILILSNYVESSFPDIQLDGVLLDFIPKCSAKNVFEQKIRKLLNPNTICK